MKAAKRRWLRFKFNRRIRNVLLVYYLTPVLLFFLGSGVLFYFSAQSALDEEMGQRLLSVARAAAGQLRAFHVTALELHDPASETFTTLQERFERIRAEYGMARVYVFNSTNESLIDTDTSVPPGAPYARTRLHVTEIERALKGEAAASVLFRGSDGEFYKSAFAPVREGNQVVAVVGVDASATFFHNLHRLGRSLAIFAIACVVLIILVSILLARRIVHPVQSLVRAAQRIGDGHLETPVEMQGGLVDNEIGFLGYVLDEMRKNIVARDQELQTMLRGIAHEVRNPLGGIQLFAGMLEEESTGERGKEAAKRIQREVATLERLVEEFLDFARGPALQYSKVNVGPFLEDLRIAFRKDLDEKGIALHTETQNADQADFDPDQMRRACLNLLRNSIQATPRGGRIDIGAQAVNGQVEMTFRDTGVGIPADQLDKIFDPFFTTKDRGTGLGLSFVRKIVSAHGGEVRAESTPGAGTTITVVLPR